ncbi:trypsin-like serine protease [Methylorubrum extorquens]|uniref:Trypsin-like serine protease n=1 Tax=Methylorubrum extorquens TaxID=408 RepID=A0AAX3WJD8_METEX|nr:MULTISPECIES: trypsin-like serine protease [Methylobacteriaceae]KQQ24732.1 peptidase S1 [Methylobacterium sp. Leaf122]WHQ71527.1 trypsin-like serine protease [Methylorubrum extorquens]
MRAPNPALPRSAGLGLGAAALTLLLAATPATAIVGGREGAEVPGAASAVMVLTSGGGVCSGIVVAPDAVLTAGHCVAGVGENRVHYRDETGRPVLAETAARSLHPAYDGDAIRGRTRSIDLALLRTREPLPARFVPAALSAAMPRAGQSLTLAGYGAARGGDRRSIGRYRGATLAVVEPYGPSRILVWLKAPGAGGCQGDSGGPILDGAAVVAVAAWVKDACGGLTQGILLGPQRDWIDRTLSGWGASARW